MNDFLRSYGNPAPELPWEEHRFAREQKILNPLRIGHTIRASAEIEMEHDIMFHEMVYRLEATVLQDTLVEDIYDHTVYYRYPETTWQMFKSRHQNSWWMRRFVAKYPVRMKKEYETVKLAVERSYIYPESDMVLQQLGRPVKFETLRRIE